MILLRAPICTEPTLATAPPHHNLASRHRPHILVILTHCHSDSYSPLNMESLEVDPYQDELSPKGMGMLC